MIAVEDMSALSRQYMVFQHKTALQMAGLQSPFNAERAVQETETAFQRVPTSEAIA